MKNYNEEKDQGHFVTVDVPYPEKLHEFHNEFTDWKSRRANVTNLHDKTEYVIRITNLWQALNHGLIFKKVSRVIKKLFWKRFI